MEAERMRWNGTVSRIEAHGLQQPRIGNTVKMVYRMIVWLDCAGQDTSCLLQTGKAIRNLSSHGTSPSFGTTKF